MRCEHCGRPLKNAHMWQLTSDHDAPSARSMRQLCWSCRERAAYPEREQEAQERANAIIAEAYAVVMEAEARNI